MNSIYLFNVLFILGYVLCKIQNNKIQLNITENEDTKWLYDQINNAVEKANIFASIISLCKMNIEV